jgi:PPP family 3-phenylpropionic acid transporter
VARARRSGFHARIDPTPETLRTRVFVRLASYYAATFAVLGVYMQYFPVWLLDVGGLTHREVTQAQTGQILARTIAGPLWAQRVDRRGRPMQSVVLLTALSCATFALFPFAHGLWPLFVCCALYGCVYPPLHAILDNMTIEAAREHAFHYPRVRMWGSLAFLLVIVAVGVWLERASARGVFWLLLGLLLVSLVAAFWLPRSERPPDTSHGAPLRRLLVQPLFVLFLLASALLQGSHGAYYSLSTLHWREHGIGEGMAGLLWAEGIVAEIALFFWIRDLAERLRPTTLLLIGAAGAVVRWGVLASTVSPGVIAGVNWLHAASFGCTYLGGLRFLRMRVAPELQTTGQGLLGAATSGVGMVLGTLLAGEVYERSAEMAFWSMAGLAGLGAILALVLRRPRAAFERAENQRRSSDSTAQSTVNRSPPAAS